MSEDLIVKLIAALLMSFCISYGVCGIIRVVSEELKFKRLNKRPEVTWKGKK
jgi:hypothetical protein